jgi:tRNA(adenine34) deaminase
MKLPTLFPRSQLTRILGRGHRALATFRGLPPLHRRSETSESLEDAFDAAMMEHCIRLSREAARQGEYPFAAIICRDGEILIEATNRVRRDQDISRHAEIVALSEAQKLVGSSNLDGCTLYSKVEPCPMCAFMGRETRIRRVVFSLKSPVMGGYSRWDILSDHGLSSRMPELFGPSPEITAGVLAADAAKVWRRWNPIAWAVIRLRGIFSRD